MIKFNIKIYIRWCIEEDLFLKYFGVSTMNIYIFQQKSYSHLLKSGTPSIRAPQPGREKPFVTDSRATSISLRSRMKLDKEFISEEGRADSQQVNH